MTTIPVSTVPYAQAALLTAVQTQVSTDPEATSILVCLGEPSTNAPDGIIEIAKSVRRSVNPSSFVGSGGAGALEESYDIAVVVSVAAETSNTDADTLAVSQRAWQLAAYVESAVRFDPSLGDIVQIAYPKTTSGGEVVWAPNNVGRICELTVLIHVEAVI